MTIEKKFLISFSIGVASHKTSLDSAYHIENHWVMRLPRKLKKKAKKRKAAHDAMVMAQTAMV